MCVSCTLSVFFFFFQAEDGIRDYKVTGVQTCALPICAFLGHEERKVGALLPNACTYTRGQKALRELHAAPPARRRTAAFAARATWRGGVSPAMVPLATARR